MITPIVINIFKKCYFCSGKESIPGTLLTVNFNFINTEYIESVTGGDREIILELVNLFKEQVVEFNSEMKSLFDKKDFYSLGLLAHKAKSSVAILGISELAVMLKTFELEAKEGKNPENYPGYIERFESETRSAISELETYLTKI